MDPVLTTLRKLEIYFIRWIISSTTSYNELTGDGALGVEFGGTAVTSPSSFGAGISPADADKVSSVFVANNAELQWSEGSFRGFFTLTIDPQTLNATFYGMKDVCKYISYFNQVLV
ncbi:hypothetical protein C0993_005925 [Termitomyces sp. T159_Od127]|nr:hypothetical protein C0993_005925 [Termitomyces sp. T159_Od127]